MEKLQVLISSVNDVIWSYLLVGVLIICAIWFTVRSGFLQFRSVPEMCRLLTERRSRDKSKDGRRSISSFQAFAVSIASRVGTGNLAGVATAIVVGGPGAVFWMWIMALFGSASAFVESTLAQLYKRPAKDGTFIGGPAYYMERGIGKRWMGVLFAVLISVTFGFAFNSVQSNTICASWELAFNMPAQWMGIILTVLTLVIIFGGIRRIAGVSSLLVPVMALLYIALAFVIIAMNIKEIPEVLGLIVSDAFGFGDGNGGGWKELAGGGIGATIMQGVKRGMFSNEAGMGSAPNVAATADTTHPVKQGLIQALGVFTDTLIICSCTAFIILIGGVSDASVDGIQLTQTALTAQIGPIGEIFIALTILMFAFSSVIGNYYYGEANIRFITKKKWVLNCYRILVAGMVLCGALITLDLAWALADLTMALMALCNLIAIMILSPQAFRLLSDYRSQKKAGIKNPVFKKESLPDIKDKLECW